MKILLVREYFYPDVTGPTVMSDLMRYLCDHYSDLEIEVIASRNYYKADGVLPAEDNWDGIHITRLAAPKSKRPGLVFRLLAGTMFTIAVLRTLNRMKARPDVIFVLSDPPMLPEAIKRYARRTGIPYVYLVPDLFPDLAIRLGAIREGSTLARIAHNLQKGWLQAAKTVVVIGRCMRDYFAKTYDLPAEKIAVVTNSADPEFIHPLPKVTRFRREHNLDGFLVLYSGNLGQHQRFEDIFEVAKLLEDHPEIHIVFVGAGAKRDEVAAYIAESGTKNIMLLPPVPFDELGDLLASADVSLVTLEPGAEGLGVPSKFYNILASGRPTVAIVSPTTEVARVLEEADCGLRADQGNPQQLADAILALYRDPAARERLGRNARETMLANYTITQIADQYYRVFCEAANIQPNVPIKK